MQHPALPLAQNLGYASLIPFVVPAFLVWILPESYGLQASELMRSYAATILAFLSGLLWFSALQTEQDEALARQQLWHGITFSLIAWASLWVNLLYALPALLLSFWLLRRAEVRLLIDKHYPLWFIELRDWLTRIVLASHISVWVF
ncbi:MAG: DUF3429 domain-containing protein, partial [Oleiphilaceae bacterium]|nr:DUF3429 domain-containing protein [Oleiphilaceae bacterium]